MSYTHILFTVEYRKHQTVKMYNFKKEMAIFFYFMAVTYLKKVGKGHVYH